MKKRLLLVVLLAVCSRVSVADTESVFREYVDNNIGTHRDFEWRESRRFVDSTHVHATFQLYYRGRRVLDHFLKLHYNRQGFLEHVSNLWEKPFELAMPRDTREMRAELETRLADRYSTARHGFRGSLVADPVIYLENGHPVPAFEVRLTVFDRNLIRHFVEEEGTGRNLEERNVFRGIDLTSKAWKVSPFVSLTDNTLAPTDVTLPGLDASDRMKNSYFYVRREQGTTTKALVDIDPRPGTGDFVFTTDPDTYSATCTGASTVCPNQRVDGTNVYFHLNGYRDKAQGYLTTQLKVSPSPMSAFEPIDVIINALSVDVDRDGDLEDEVNNAGYIPGTCTSTGGTSIPRCIIFLRPKSGSSLACGEGNKKFFDLAREAMVIVHEYQHFVIDTIVQLIPGTSSKKNVGDALHEGFADYFAASHVSEVAGRDVTKIGEYGFQQCTFFQRDIGTLRVYQNGAAETDEHVAGQSWASGLWQLRNELGREKVDLLALKSIFFLSSRPGFYESVESLVKADQALNNGANVSRIRKLFYEEIRWVGGQTSFFKDSEKGIADVGFTSCNAVHGSPAGGGSRLPLGILVWMLALVGTGRRLARRVG